MNYTELKVQAEASLVGYKNLSEGMISTEQLDDIEGYSERQREAFARQIIVLSAHQDSTGLSATVFQDTNTGRVLLAVRGTEFTSVSDLLSALRRVLQDTTVLK